MKNPTLQELLSELAETQGRMRRVRAEHADAASASRDSLAQSRELLTEADAMLAKGDKAFIEEYYGKAGKA